MKRELLLFFCCLCSMFISCSDGPGVLADKKVKEGYELSRKYCATCHLYPEASMLDKKTWQNHVLPKMAPYLGFQLFAGSYMANDSGSIITIEQWNNIQRYFISEAPEEPLKRSKDIDIANETSLFSETPFDHNIESPSTTLVLIDSSKKRILFGDGMTGKMYILSQQLQVTDSVNVGTGLAHVRMKDNEYWMLTMGVMHPSDERSGTLLIGKDRDTVATKLLDSLQRPVNATYADLNNDGKEDIVLSEFGDRYGALSWFEMVGINQYRKHLLRGLPGAIKTMVTDLNHDGKPDIVALMAQGDEGIFIYYNNGNGSFEEKRALRFPPSYGSNYFELADFNGDSFPDIITSNGDNGDYPPILKRYHGIRIFLNNGHNEFEEKTFLPVNGIGKVIARDFDNDGDLDLASIAYFADFRNKPAEAFIYWENNGKGEFKASTIKNVLQGRWITMDAGDYDGDGDLDIVLGNADFRLGDIPAELKKKWDSYSPSLLILQNNLHRSHEEKRKQ